MRGTAPSTVPAGLRANTTWRHLLVLVIGAVPSKMAMISMTKVSGTSHMHPSGSSSIPTKLVM